MNPLGETRVERLSPTEIADIMSCLHQHCLRRSEGCDFHSLMVLFPEAANAYFNAKTKPGEYSSGGSPEAIYCIKVKLVDNFRYPEVLAHAQALWAAGFIPIEVTRLDGSAFYAIPQEAYFNRDLRNVMIVYAETIIPPVNDCYLLI